MIGILSAIPEELNGVLYALKRMKKETIGNRTFYQGELRGREVVISHTLAGKVAAASTTTTLILKFAPKELLFTGVAGSVDPETKVGDIVIGRDLFQHDMDARPLFPQFEIPFLGTATFSTSESIRNRLVIATNHFLKNGYSKESLNVMKELHVHRPAVHIGDIASGDQFVTDRSMSDRIRLAWPGVKCVEMEGAPVGQVSADFGIPFGIFRIISDNADHDSHIDFNRFVGDISSFYSQEILKQYLSADSVN